jgi:hypothetical protein
MDNRGTTNKYYLPTKTSLLRGTETPAANSSYKKLAVQWLNEALCFVSSLVVADSLVLRNRQLHIARERYWRLVRNDADINNLKR